MQLITAFRIHSGRGWMPEGTTLELSDEGIITAIYESAPEGTLFYEGTLAPGFINVHCHLELSHMKGLVPEGTGLIPFLKTIPKYRNNFTDDQKRQARQAALYELLDNGVVAVGDIANTIETADLRAKDVIHFRTFVEALGFNDQNAPRSFDYALATYNHFEKQCPVSKQLNQSIVPHAPYSVSSSLFKRIDKFKLPSVISIHNQESEEENKFYYDRSGLICDLLQSMGIDYNAFEPSGKTSLTSYLPLFSPDHHFILVHNTYSTLHDVRFVKEHVQNVFWCLCPNANIYIEGRLADIPMLMNEGAKICIGTDSLASNHQLSILAELVTIKRHYPQIEWEQLLCWATSYGAEALMMDAGLGNIAIGMQPGIVLIKGIDDSSIDVSVSRIC